MFRKPRFASGTLSLAAAEQRAVLGDAERPEPQRVAGHDEVAHAR